MQRFVISKPGEHLAAEHCEKEKEQDGDFEVIGMRRSDFGEIIKTAGEHHRAANHPGHFEIGQILVIEHPVKFPEPDHSEHAD